MPSAKACQLANIAENVASDLYRITITDAWHSGQGGNVEVASQSSQRHSMTAVMSGIASTGGVAPTKAGGRNILQHRDEWIAQGRRTLSAGKGVCTDCAAVTAVEFVARLDDWPYELTVEILSTGRHAFVVVNRQGAVHAPNQWGNDCFCIDIWYRNQFPKDRVTGVYWSNKKHPAAEHMRANAQKLRVEAVIVQPLGSLFD